MALGGRRRVATERACDGKRGAGRSMLARVTIHEEEFGKLGDGGRARVFTLEGAGGVRVRVLDYGGTVVSIEVTDRDGRLGDVVLGFDDLEGYLGAGGYLGSLIGRYGNRIGGARFALEGVEHRVTANEGGNHLHGGGETGRGN